MKVFWTSFFLVLSTSVFAQNLSSKQWDYWHKLLHARKNLIGQYISEIDSEGFFVDPEGKKNPDKELKSFIELLNSEKGQETVCRYPLRYKWLKANVPNQWNFSTDACTVYQAFKNKMDAKSISLVFSSFYINNPGSTFGHTFLRVSRYPQFRTNELLDYAINFAAQDSKDNFLFYMVKGLAGFYPGKFSVVPYYYKIREYSDHEFRDVWDYDLGLKQEQIDRVIDHIWELGSTHFDYFYFTENCSYHILGLLNVAYDDVDLLAGLSPLYVLPIDTVKEMQKLHLVKDRKVRVSAYGKLIKETEGLSQNELNLVKEVAKHPGHATKLQNYDQKKQAKLLDASISALDYLEAEAILLNEAKATEKRRELLMMRAENPEISEDLRYDYKKMYPPDESHNSSRLGFSAGERLHDGAFGGLEWRAAQHELLDPSQGQLKNSQVTMFETKLRYQTIEERTNNIIIEKFRLVDLKKYQASDFWNDSISWDFGAGLDQRKECISRNCLNPTVTFGVGSSVDINQDMILSFLLGGSYRYDAIYENNSLLSLGPKLNFLVLKEKYSMGLDAGYFMPTELFEEWLHRRISYDLEFRYFLSQNINVFLKSNHIDQDVGNIDETQVGLYFFH